MASPITSSLSRPWSHGSSSVNIVTPIGARHAGDVSAPEAALRAERVDDLADVFVDVAVGVGLATLSFVIAFVSGRYIGLGVVSAAAPASPPLGPARSFRVA